jgi:hypothetical protein
VSNDLRQDPRYMEARRRVRREAEFYKHLLTYVIVMAGLVVINFLTSPGYFWVIWPMLGWGIGVVVHGLQTFAGNSFGRKWEERKIREYMERDDV